MQLSRLVRELPDSRELVVGSALRELWSDPDFLKLIGTPHANGVVPSAPAPGAPAPSVNGNQAGDTRIVTFSNTAADTAPGAPGGNGTGDVTRPVHKNGKPNESDAIADANKRFAERHPNGPKQPRFQHPGDGQVVSVERAFEELRKKSGIVLESGSRAFHKEIWQQYMGKQGEPPIAFKYAGRIRLDVMALTPEQLESFKTLSKAQAAAIAVGGGDRGAGAKGDSNRTTVRHGSGDTHLPNGNGKGGTGGGRPGDTHVSHPPPPPSAPPPPPEPKPVFRLKPKPGDGEVVSLEKAFEELGKKTGKVIESGSHAWHRKTWNEQLQKPGEPPIAYTSGGKIRVDIERLTPQQLETFIQLERAQAAALAARTGHDFGGGKGSGGNGAGAKGDGGAQGGGAQGGGAQGGGAKGGGAKGGGGANAGGAVPDAANQALANKVNDYDARVKKLQERFDSLQRKQASGGASSQLAAERASLSAEQKALIQEGETLSLQLAATAKQEMQAAFKTADPKELLKMARKGLPGRATVGVMAFSAVTLASAYFIALDIRYILDADNALEALKRAGQVGANYAVGTAEFVLFKVITGSNAVTAVLAMVVGMCSDQAGGCEAQEAAKKKEQEAKQARQRARQEFLAIGAFLAKHVPGSVMWVEDTYVILNQKVWDETVKKIDQMQREYRAERKANVFKRARDLGMADAKAMGKFLHNDEMKGWPEVKEHLTDEYELFDYYKKGFNEGNKKRAAVMHRATQLGYQDGKIGAKAHYDDIFNWPEVAQLLQEGAIAMFLYQELAASYNDAFDIKTGKKDPYEGLYN